MRDRDREAEEDYWDNHPEEELEWKKKDKIFRRLGENIYYLTQQADPQVHKRWSQLGLTQEFADFIVQHYKIYEEIY